MCAVHDIARPCRRWVKRAMRLSALLCLVGLLIGSEAKAQDGKSSVESGPANGENRSQLEPIATKAAPKSVVILPPELVEIEDDGLAQQLAEVMAEALQRPELRVVTREDIQELAKAEKSRTALSCKEDKECLSRIQELTTADLFLAGSVGRLGRELTVTLQVLEPRTGNVLNRAVEVVTERKNLISVAGPLALRVFRLEGGPAVTFELEEKNVVFGVFGIDATGVDDDTTANLEQFVSVELSKIRGAKVISPADIRVLLARERIVEGLGGECSDECMVAISGALNVTYIVKGQIGRLDSEYVISFRLLEPRLAEVVNRKTETFRGPDEELKRAVRTIVRRLVGVESNAPGTILVSGPVSGGEVFVDGKLLGPLPAKPEEPFPSQRLAVRITKGGFYDWESDVFVQPGENNVVWAELKESPAPVYEQWWFWTLVGVGVVGAASAVIAVSASGSPDSGSGTVILEPSTQGLRF